ncbi:hypothetical protein [Streptomyces sp. SAS_270]|uniref:hypothetical protein n=1 Tax=Streptomyces sp. SAS_270 TaxID=3412748 RepID=UPI00403C5136
MTDTNAFNFGAQENWFARYSDPKNQAERAARKAQEELDAQRQAEAEQAAQLRTQVMYRSGPAIISLIRQYVNSNRPAMTTEIRNLFKQQLKGATDHEFQESLECLKQQGEVIEKATTTGYSGASTEGFMGERVTNLWVVADLG